MKFHLRVFIVAFVVFSVIIGTGMFFATRGHSEAVEANQGTADIAVLEDQLEEIKKDERTDLEKAVDGSERVNIVFYGIDGGRADTIMFVSYDPDQKIVDVVSIPRDTYHHVEGYNAADQKKINAVYGFKNGGGSEGLKTEISGLLNVPVDYYVKVKYEGVEDIVNVLGGVEVTVPFDMKYDDPYCDPPLHINLKKGKQVLDGDKAIQFLRWRKNNGEGGDGDLGRIGRQQQFLNAAAKKAFSFKLPSVIKTAFNYVQTDMALDEMIYYGTTSVGMDLSELKTYRLPGSANDSGSYYIHDPLETENLMLEIYKREKGKEEEVANSN